MPYSVVYNILLDQYYQIININYLLTCLVDSGDVGIDGSIIIRFSFNGAHVAVSMRPRRVSTVGPLKTYISALIWLLWQPKLSI